MDFSTMPPREVARQTQRVVDMLRASDELVDVYYRLPRNNAPIIYATVTRGILAGTGVVIREYQVERLATLLLDNQSA